MSSHAPAQQPAGYPMPVGYSLRAAVAATCNMACQYCPRYTSMENYTPPEHRDRDLTHPQYLDILRALLRTLRFSVVSLTGGEPLINPRLPEIAHLARSYSDRLELNTNGLLVTPPRWRPLAPLVDRVKISLDTLDHATFKAITEAPGSDPLARVLAAIDLMVDSGADVALNCVVSRTTIDTLDALLAYATGRGLRLHLLDYYYTDERRENWEREFVPLESLMPYLSHRYGQPEAQSIFGCGFYDYHAPAGAPSGSVIRIKTSYSGTMRAPRCTRCPRYCQEGMYGLKLSTEGWLTTCPSNHPADGVLLQPGMTPSQVHAAAAPLLDDLAAARHDPYSMQTLVQRRGLSTEPGAASALFTAQSVLS